jgi:hypothetical protein
MSSQIFISYSHDNEKHKNWVLQLATRLRSNGVDVILDLWNLKLGQDLALFMEKGLSKSQRVLCVCSEIYVDKSNNKAGGVGYEKQIMTAELMENLNTNRIIPIIRNNNSSNKVPVFLKGRAYISFEDDILYESKYEELLRDLLDEPVLPIPELGENPFENIKKFSQQKFMTSNEKYTSPAKFGTVVFNYSNNNGRYFIGTGELMFELYFSKSSNDNIQLYNEPKNIITVAVVKDTDNIKAIKDARVYDSSSRVRRPNINQIAIVQNTNGFYAAIKILSIKDDTRGYTDDEISFEYTIQTNGTPDFTVII